MGGRSGVKSGVKSDAPDFGLDLASRGHFEELT
jgi:hypothetical protein